MRRTIVSTLVVAIGLGFALGSGSLTPHAAAVAYSVTMADVTVNEGGATAGFVATISPSPSGTDVVTVDYTTDPGSATEGVDYTNNTATLTFTAGDTTEAFNVTITEDGDVEGPETFFVNLIGQGTSCTAPCTSPTVVAESQAMGTIVDNEPAPSSFRVNDVSQNEGNAGTTPFVFSVTVDPPVPVGQTHTVNYHTTDGTANAGSDYAFQAGTLTFVGGAASVQNIQINISGDAVAEPNETFNFNLTGAACTVGCPPGVSPTVADGLGVGTIQNDDGNTSDSVSIGDASVNEGDTATFAVTRGSACPGGTTLTIPFDTRSFSTGVPAGTATEGNDYPRTSGTVVLSGGESSRNLTVNTTEDAFTEAAETFSVFLGTPSGTCTSTVSDGEGVGTITDDDGGPPPPPAGSVLNAGSIQVNEGNTGTRLCRVPVTLSPAAAGPVTVQYATQDGTATAGSDYNATSGTLTFAPGEVSKTVDVTIISDRVDEPRRREKLFVNLSSPTGATIGTTQGKCKIYEGRRG